jgi:hypothetical protein
MTRRTWMGIAGLGALVGLGYLLSRPSDERVLSGLVGRLCEAVSVSGEQNAGFDALRLRGQFAELLTKDATFFASEGEARGRDELVRLATLFRQVFRRARLTAGRLDVQVEPASAYAEGRCTILLDGDRGDGPRVDRRDVTFRFQRLDGAWRISSIRVAAREGAAGP